MIKPDPENPGKSLLVVDGKLYRADFRLPKQPEKS
jgi:hypothetical protein